MLELQPEKQGTEYIMHFWLCLMLLWGACNEAMFCFVAVPQGAFRKEESSDILPQPTYLLSSGEEEVGRGSELLWLPEELILLLWG